jgi:hypothetical protein
MAEPKTVRNGADVQQFLQTVPDPKRRADAQALCRLLADATGAEPEMWGDSIVGFGAYHYRYGSGQTGEWPAVGLSPRRQALTIYVAESLESHGDLLARLGPHRTGKSCLYVKRLSDVDEQVLRELVTASFRRVDGTTITPGSK